MPESRTPRASVTLTAAHRRLADCSLADFESLPETAYLLRSPANARRPLDAMERLESGGGEERDLLDEDE